MVTMLLLKHVLQSVPKVIKLKQARPPTQDCQASYRRKAFGTFAHAFSSLQLGQTRMPMRSAKVFPLDSLGDAIGISEGLGRLGGKDSQPRNTKLLLAI